MIFCEARLIHKTTLETLRAGSELARTQMSEANDRIDHGMNSFSDVTERMQRSAGVLDAYTPDFDAILAAIPESVRGQIEAILDISLMQNDWEAGQRSAKAAAGEYEYAWIAQRTNSMQRIAVIARTITDGINTLGIDEYKKTNDSLDWTGDVQAAQAFKDTLREHGHDQRTDNDALNEATKDFERQMGSAFFTLLSGVIDKYEITEEQLNQIIAKAHKKYGLPNADDTFACAYCGENTCGCGNRPDTETADEVAERREQRKAENSRQDFDPNKHNFETLVRSIVSVYAQGRNGAFSNGVGAMRGLAEIHGELRACMDVYDRILVDQDLEQALQVAPKRVADDIRGKLAKVGGGRANKEVVAECLFGEIVDLISWPAIIAADYGIKFEDVVDLYFEENQADTTAQ